MTRNSALIISGIERSRLIAAPATPRCAERERKADEDRDHRAPQCDLECFQHLRGDVDEIAHRLDENRGALGVRLHLKRIGIERLRRGFRSFDACERGQMPGIEILDPVHFGARGDLQWKQLTRDRAETVGDFRFRHDADRGKRGLAGHRNHASHLDALAGDPEQCERHDDDGDRTGSERGRISPGGGVHAASPPLAMGTGPASP
jgi:hypothetical protein